MNLRIRVFRCLFVTPLLVVGCWISGCADTRGGSIPYDRPLPAPDEQTFQTLPQEYKIAPLDKLSIKLFGEDGSAAGQPASNSITGDYSVDLAGRISLPLIGEVEAANLTTEQLDHQLTKLYGEKYFEDPDISVAIEESTAHVVTVDGAVQQAGQYQIAGPMTLIQAVALAKGTTEDANAHRVAVFRMIGGQRQAAAFDLAAIRRGKASDPPVYPGDIIVVDGSSIKAAEKQFFRSVPLLAIFRPF